MQQLPETGFVRIKTLTGDKSATPPTSGLLAFSRSKLWADVKAKKFPAPIKLGGVTAWRVEDIRAYIKGQGA